MDYDKLVKEFGAERFEVMPDELKDLRMAKYIVSHRDFLSISKKPFAIVSGRGPSGKFHLGHLATFMFVKQMQDKYKCRVFIPFSNDEKFLLRGISFEDAQNYAMDNLLDIIALGFDPELTDIIIDLYNLPQDLYNLAIRVSRKITYSTVKALLGFTSETNIGLSFYSAMQVAHILYPTMKYGLPSVVIVAIDQDPFIRLTRDIAEKLGYHKPGALHLGYIPSLQGEQKMSSSSPYSAIFTTDDPETVKKKVMNAFTGGRETLSLQKEKGGNPSICSVYAYLDLFGADTEQIKKDCLAGKRMCGDCKKELITLLNAFLDEHRRKREKSKNLVRKFLK